MNVVESETKSMSIEPTYQAARAVAPTVEAHFAYHLGAARERGEQELAPEPDAQTIEAIIDATFWASLRREEGRSPKISLAFFPHEQVPQPLIFERPLSLAPATLTKLDQRSSVRESISASGVIRLVNYRCGARRAKCRVSVLFWKLLSRVCW